MVAQLSFTISCYEDDMDIDVLLPSLRYFKTDSADDAIFELVLDNRPDIHKPSNIRQLIKTIDTGNGETTVYTLIDGGHEFMIKDITGRYCALLTANNDFSICRCTLNGTQQMCSFGANDALMLVYAFASCRHSALLIHASCICKDGWAYPFIAKSGIGKSTHSSKWMNVIEGAQLLNDDNPVVRIIDSTVYVFGSPWSGKTPCYRNKKCRLGALVRIERDNSNHCERMTTVNAFATLFTSCSSMMWDKITHQYICDNITAILESSTAYTMYCLPDDQAAHVCYHTVGKDQNCQM